MVRCCSAGSAAHWGVAGGNHWLRKGSAPAQLGRVGALRNLPAGEQVSGGREHHALQHGLRWAQPHGRRLHRRLLQRHLRPARLDRVLRAWVAVSTPVRSRGLLFCMCSIKPGRTLHQGASLGASSLCHASFINHPPHQAKAEHESIFCALFRDTHQAACGARTACGEAWKSVAWYRVGSCGQKPPGGSNGASSRLTCSRDNSWGPLQEIHL